MIDRLGVGVHCVESSEGELEEASWVLWPDGASDAEAETLHHLQLLLMAFRNGTHKGRQRYCVLGCIMRWCVLCCI